MKDTAQRYDIRRRREKRMYMKESGNRIAVNVPQNIAADIHKLLVETFVEW